MPGSGLRASRGSGRRAAMPGWGQCAYRGNGGAASAAIKTAEGADRIGEGRIPSCFRPTTA